MFPVARELLNFIHLIASDTFYNLAALNRSALLITETELKLMAAAAIMGESKIPKKG